ncbi:MAG: hypothetical protein ACOZAR_01525 [Patescibacteria group bacterium]
MRTIEEKTTTTNSDWHQQKIEIKNFLEEYLKDKKNDISIKLTLGQIRDNVDFQEDSDDFFQYCCRRYDNLKKFHSFGSVDETENHENMMRNMQELQKKVLKPLEYLVKTIADILGKEIPQNRI